MTKLKPLFFFFFGIALVTSPLLLLGQVDQSFNFGILPFQSLTISGQDADSVGTTSAISFPEPTEEDLQRGYIEKREIIELTVESNVPWALSFYTDAENMGISNDGSYIKPIQHFQVRVDGSRYQGLKNDSQSFLFGTATKKAFAVDYRMLLDRENHSPGSYQATVTYILASR